MFYALLILQFAISLLLLLSVLIQRTGKQSLGDFDSGMQDSDNKFIIKFTWMLVVLFFINSIILGNIASKDSKKREIIKYETLNKTSSK